MPMRRSGRKKPGPTKRGEIWTLQDAKARFSEVVRQARSGKPQHVTIHGKEAVIIIDPNRFEYRPLRRQPETMAGFIAESKRFCGGMAGVEFEPRLGMKFDAHMPFDEEAT